MRVLVGCEFSGAVREAFRKRGHDAWSCDLLDAEDESQFHIKGDLLQVLNNGTVFRAKYEVASSKALFGLLATPSPLSEAVSKLLTFKAQRPYFALAK